MAEVDVYTGHGSQPAISPDDLSASQQHHVFSYRHDAREALSLTMPLRHESYSYAQLHPIFQMNLPEGALREALERMTAKQYGSDDLTLAHHSRHTSNWAHGLRTGRPALAPSH
ncbi:MAG: HipA N-terminal domain-containing protein [Candidatus Thiothrix sulfatifontis]|nr:MAG: HipA N-terminal domain-containing protein [Candidatus Thiothrix sulfatifontis]